MKMEMFIGEEHPFRRTSEFASSEFLEKLSPSDRKTEVKTHFSGESDRLALMEIKEVANGESVLHYHDEEEIFYVLEGELWFGKQVIKAGDSINIAAGTQYKFKTGPEGLRYLKFSATADHSVNVVESRNKQS